MTYTSDEVRKTLAEKVAIILETIREALGEAKIETAIKSLKTAEEKAYKITEILEVTFSDRKGEYKEDSGSGSSSGNFFQRLIRGRQREQTPIERVNHDFVALSSLLDEILGRVNAIMQVSEHRVDAVNRDMKVLTGESQKLHNLVMREEQVADGREFEIPSLPDSRNPIRDITELELEEIQQIMLALHEINNVLHKDDSAVNSGIRMLDWRCKREVTYSGKLIRELKIVLNISENDRITTQNVTPELLPLLQQIISAEEYITAWEREAHDDEVNIRHAETALEDEINQIKDLLGRAAHKIEEFNAASGAVQGEIHTKLTGRRQQFEESERALKEAISKIIELSHNENSFIKILTNEITNFQDFHSNLQATKDIIPQIRRLLAPP